MTDATNDSNDYTLLLLSYPNYVYRRRVTDGLERDFRALTGFGEHLETLYAIAWGKVEGSPHMIVQSSAGTVAVWNYHDENWLDEIVYVYAGAYG